MKNSNMRAPAVTQLLQQKILYQAHLRKLEKIREERKTHLQQSNRLLKHEEIKHNKSRSFAYRYNEQHSEITHLNKQLLNKLQKVKPFTRYSSFSTYEREEPEQRTRTPFQKRRMIETQKQNSRIFMRIKSVSSSLSKDNLQRDFAKSQQIRSRIARYATQNNRVSLKSQKFINKNSLQKTNLVSHYNHQEILKNKIENIKGEMKAKEKQSEKETSERNLELPNTFFTEPKTKGIRHGLRPVKR